MFKSKLILKLIVHTICFNELNLIKIFVNLIMSDKLFMNDKNYILKKVQSQTKNALLQLLISNPIKKFEKSTNSLGLIDETSRIIQKFKIKSYKELNFFYKKISTIYRYNHGEVQLSFLWDGSSHEEFYKNRWIDFFNEEMNRMINNNSFLKSILSITALKKSKEKITEIQYNLSTFNRKKYNIQVYKRKGVVLHSK